MIAPGDAGPSIEGDAVEAAERAAAHLAGSPSLEGIRRLLLRLGDELEATRNRILLLGLDLHDGALQDIVALGTDAHLFREQLAAALGEHEHASRLLGRVDDLIGRLGYVDTTLRELAVAAESSALLRRPLTVTLQETVVSFGSETREIRLTVADDLDAAGLSDSQRIAIIRFLQAALSNVVQHSGAATATVTVAHEAGVVDVEVVDDGRGFDVDPTMRRAAERGRLGLVGMRERIRVVGGEIDLESREGGPTRVRIRLRADPPAPPRST